MSEPRLVDLVYAGEIARAVEVAASLTPRVIHAQLFLDDRRHLQDETPSDEFVRAWFASLESPYLRAEAAEWFAGTYTTELAPVPNAEYIGAYMLTESLRGVIRHVARTIFGPDLTDLEETPEHPLSSASAEQWRGVGRVLDALDLPDAVAPTAPDAR